MTRQSRTVCIDCGETYLFTSTYKGNYCADCRETWASQSAARQSESRPRPLRPRVTPSVRRIEDDDERAPSRYDEE